MPRPSKFSPELLDAIAEKLSLGIPLAEICRDEGMPNAGTVRDWMNGEVETVDGITVTRVIARARMLGHDAIAARAMLTARGKKAEEGGDSSGDVQRDKLIIDTDLKLLAKWDPKRYGDLLKLAGADGEGPVSQLQLHGELTPQQASEAYVKLLGE